jgi:hypothetical protein
MLHLEHTLYGAETWTLLETITVAAIVLKFCDGEDHFGRSCMELRKVKKGRNFLGAIKLRKVR